MQVNWTVAAEATIGFFTSATVTPFFSVSDYLSQSHAPERPRRWRMLDVGHRHWSGGPYGPPRWSSDQGDASRTGLVVSPHSRRSESTARCFREWQCHDGSVGLTPFR